jgi:hypothetical protein
MHLVQYFAESRGEAARTWAQTTPGPRPRQVQVSDRPEAGVQTSGVVRHLIRA